MSKSSTTTDKLDPVHPGEVLMEDFIKGFHITQNRLAVAVGVPPRRINEIVHGKRSITADTALRLGRYFGTSAQFWLNLQDQYDLDVEEDQIQAELDAIKPLKIA
ncbi:HigA family addiction module antitoxin [Phytohabitans kaempferiae]|uniref:HigA family addiction module antitoxin n=1 Tax=Phytohabitans kaempferiae TaxID=1620943 RepID=A0ABV6M016_9ACTN